MQLYIPLDFVKLYSKNYHERDLLPILSTPHTWTQVSFCHSTALPKAQRGVRLHPTAFTEVCKTPGWSLLILDSPTVMHQTTSPMALC